MESDNMKKRDWVMFVLGLFLMCVFFLICSQSHISHYYVRSVFPHCNGSKLHKSPNPARPPHLTTISPYDTQTIIVLLFWRNDPIPNQVIRCNFKFKIENKNRIQKRCKSKAQFVFSRDLLFYNSTSAALYVILQTLKLGKTVLFQMGGIISNFRIFFVFVQKKFGSLSQRLFFFNIQISRE